MLLEVLETSPSNSWTVVVRLGTGLSFKLGGRAVASCLLNVAKVLGAASTAPSRGTRGRDTASDWRHSTSRKELSILACDAQFALLQEARELELRNGDHECESCSDS